MSQQSQSLHTLGFQAMRQTIKMVTSVHGVTFREKRVALRERRNHGTTHLTKTHTHTHTHTHTQSGISLIGCLGLVPKWRFPSGCTGGFVIVYPFMYTYIRGSNGGSSIEG